MAVQGDYFFLLTLSFVSITIKEISDIVNLPKAIIKEIAWNVLISHHLPSSVKWGGNHTLLFDYLVPIVSYLLFIFQ